MIVKWNFSGKVSNSDAIKRNIFSDVGIRSNSGSIRNGSVVSNGLRHSIATVRSDGGSTVSEKNNHETKAFFMKAKQVNQPTESFWNLYFGVNFLKKSSPN